MKNTGWAIKGTHGFYVDWRLTRNNMIQAHTDALGTPWKICKRNGDSCVKVKIVEIKKRMKLCMKEKK